MRSDQIKLLFAFPPEQNSMISIAARSADFLCAGRRLKKWAIASRETHTVAFQPISSLSSPPPVPPQLPSTTSPLMARLQEAATLVQGERGSSSGAARYGRTILAELVLLILSFGFLMEKKSERYRRDCGFVC